MTLIETIKIGQKALHAYKFYCMKKITSLFLLVLMSGKIISQSLKLDFESNQKDSLVVEPLKKLSSEYDYIIAYATCSFQGDCQANVKIIAKTNNQWDRIEYHKRANGQSELIWKNFSAAENIDFVKKLLKSNILTLPPENKLPDCEYKAEIKGERTTVTLRNETQDGISYNIWLINKNRVRHVKYKSFIELNKICPVSERTNMMAIVSLFQNNF